MTPVLPPSSPQALVRVYDVDASDATASTPFKGLRSEAQREVAYMLGVQAGVSWRYDAIDNILEKEGPDLTTLFDFTPLLLNDGRVMPPIVTVAEDNFQLQDRTAAQAGMVTWRIVAPARIVTVPPTWESYLIQRYTVDLGSVNPALLPVNRIEREVWHQAVLQGWDDGIDHANRLYTIALATLTRDYLGAARFNLLAHEGVLTMPDLSVGNLGVVVNADTLVVGAKVYRIVEDATWQPPVDWQPKPGTSN